MVRTSLIFFIKEEQFFTIFLIKTDQYVLIEWVDYDSYSVVSVKQIPHRSSEIREFQRGEVVDVHEGTAKHKATIIASSIV